jgi:hypothetical protein
MAVQDVTELFNLRGGKKDTNGTSVRRAFRALTSQKEDDALVVINSASGNIIPEVGDDHPADDELWVKSVAPAPEGDDGQIWLVNVVYELKPPDSLSVGGSGKPWDTDPVINFSFQSRQRVFEHAYSYDESIADKGAQRDQPQVPVANVPLQLPFDPPDMITDALLLLVIQRNEKQADFDPIQIQTFQNTINDDDGPDIKIGGITFPRWTLWMRDIKANKAWDNENEPYWSVTYEMAYDPATWIKKILNNAVFKAAVPVPDPGYTITYTPIPDSAGDPVREPVPVDLNGQPLPVGGPFVYLPYHGLWEEKWAPLGLPVEY